MRSIYVIALTIGLAAPALAQDASVKVSLICYGDGSANRATGGSVIASDNNGNTGQAFVSGSEHVGFGDQVTLSIEGGGGRVRMPRAMLPRLHGGKDGWFDLRDVKVSKGEVTASVAVSILNKPKLRVDRYTGSISISGRSGDFAGSCEPFDPESAERKF